VSKNNPRIPTRKKIQEYQHVRERNVARRIGGGKEEREGGENTNQIERK
jgi:hypothetical protein